MFGGLKETQAKTTIWGGPPRKDNPTITHTHIGIFPEHVWLTFGLSLSAPLNRVPSASSTPHLTQSAFVCATDILPGMLLLGFAT